ncbi:long-chain-fatty-acid--CoA ligase [Nocardia iowensis]|uniref:Long-chain-fatty-acid--CoA ligase n=1 Tax=Nocardia iowensis TaxID=204891 RepID=A0ABX8RHC1_NOCIO|nr:long-chain-fatty-acid--CoA ligase [Nocardia iowensis]QXN88354.1 long-chain-fatty-acid--CoA ligase [Nocardia iowensis]
MSQSFVKTHHRADNLAAVIGEHAMARPDSTAIVCGDDVTDYATMHRVSHQVAHALLAAGLERGDRIAYLGRDSARLYQLLIGCSIIGTVLVPINWRLTSAEVTHIITDADCEIVFLDSAAEELAANLPPAGWNLARLIRMDRDGIPGAAFTDWIAAQPDTPPAARTTQIDPLLQMYTSGTTGASKGVVIAQRSLFVVWDILHQQGFEWLQMADDDRCFVAIPGFHIAGLGWVVQGLIAGAPLFILPEFTPGRALDIIRSHSITVMCGVPVMLALILAEPGISRADFAGLRQIAYSGSPIPEDMLVECMTSFGCEFVQFYGMTETATPLTFLPPTDHKVGSPRLRSAGFPYPGCAMAVVDPAGNRLPPGEIGEIMAHGPAPMLGYWNRPEATADIISADGWIHTGDAGWIDQDGYVYICDRIKDMIIIGGENIYPAEVENAIVGHPAVREAAVVGVPDDRWGETVHAFVALVPGRTVTQRELVLFLRDKLASFKHPRHVEFVDYLPRNASGKILRRKLRERFWADRDRAVN